MGILLTLFRSLFLWPKKRIPLRQSLRCLLLHGCSFCTGAYFGAGMRLKGFLPFSLPNKPPFNFHVILLSLLPLYFLLLSSSVLCQPSHLFLWLHLALKCYCFPIRGLSSPSLLRSRTTCQLNISISMCHKHFRSGPRSISVSPSANPSSLLFC